MSILVAVNLDDPLAGVLRGTRVEATEAALDLLAELTRTYGPVALFHPGSALDGTAIICLPHTDDMLDDSTTVLGEVDGALVHIPKDQHDAWSDIQCVIDVVRGHGNMFSLDSGVGRRFFTRCRMFSAAERANLEL